MAGANPGGGVRPPWTTQTWRQGSRGRVQGLAETQAQVRSEAMREQAEQRAREVLSRSPRTTLRFSPLLARLTKLKTKTVSLITAKGYS